MDSSPLIPALATLGGVYEPYICFCHWAVPDTFTGEPLTHTAPEFIAKVTQLNHFLVAPPGSIDRAAFEAWLPAPGASLRGDGSYDIGMYVTFHTFMSGESEPMVFEALGRWRDAAKAAPRPADGRGAARLGPHDARAPHRAHGADV